jgi:hypothetical protein
MFYAKIQAKKYFHSILRFFGQIVFMIPFQKKSRHDIFKNLTEILFCRVLRAKNYLSQNERKKVS